MAPRYKGEKGQARVVDLSWREQPVGKRLVARGLLSEEAYGAHRGEYLPRVYLKYLLPQGFAISGRPKPSDMGYLKRRKDIPKDVRDLILGEITDPAFLSAKGWIQPSRDMAILDFLNQVAQTEAWVLPDGLVEFDGMMVTPLYLKAEAARVRQMAGEHFRSHGEAILDDFEHFVNHGTDPGRAWR